MFVCGLKVYLFILEEKVSLLFGSITVDVCLCCKGVLSSHFLYLFSHLRTKGYLGSITMDVGLWGKGVLSSHLLYLFSHFRRKAYIVIWLYYYGCTCLWCKHVLSCHFLYLFLDHARIDNTSSTL
jgi:hypothetical protein